MVDVGKREDRMLDEISALSRRQRETRALLDFYLEAHMIQPEVASHLWEVLSGIEVVVDGVEESRVAEV